ncbi:N-methylhydantoinase A [Rhizobiales bacterium GAS113]|nr:N-methylhydantoinase A [Rhizobiales bacterium GAS113]
MGYRIGVDIGGSFTDFAVLDEASRSLSCLKVFSRPDAPGEEVLAGMQGLGERFGMSPQDVTYFTHGTTVGVNTVIQRKGFALGLVTTKNFEDVLELARLKIPDMYNIRSKRPTPLIPRDRVGGVVERMDADGSVVEPLDLASVKAAYDKLRAAGCEGAVVALLHSYRNPAHEHAVKKALAEIDPDFFVLCSSDVWPIIREYERTMTAVIGGYVQPRVAHYLSSLQQALRQVGVQPELRVTKSNGGVMTAEHAKTNCVQMILSGTASGVIGAAYIAEQCRLERAMSIDIGGTSADLALIVKGRPQYGVGETIGEFQIYIPSVAVSSIGEGGGSIAWVDPFGVLKVGPESAGSNPGPACYGRGGTRPTITDAFAAMGLLGHSELGYNSVSVVLDAARRAVGTIADKIGTSIEQAAEMIVNVAISGMYADASGIMSKFGADPRQFSLIAFGGAGPMLTCFLAREFHVEQVVVPTTPGVLSALGGLIADLKSDFVRTVYADLTSANLSKFRDVVAELKQRALAWLRDEQGYKGEPTIHLSADMRYKGQSFEIETPLEEADLASLATMSASFNREHERMYGHADPAAAMQVIALRLVVVGRTPKPDLARLPRAAAPPASVKQIEAWFDGRRRAIPLYARSALLAGHEFPGPCVVAQDDCTTCVPPGFGCRVDDYGNLFISSQKD